MDVVFFLDERIVNTVGKSLGVHQFPSCHEELLVALSQPPERPHLADSHRHFTFAVQATEFCTAPLDS